MKYNILVTFLMVAFFSHQPYAQDNSIKSNLLTSYFNLKNALVQGNFKNASIQASQMIKDISYTKKLSDAKIQDKILEDASHIAASKDISHQRDHFARLSKNMLIAVKELKLNTTKIYYDYCPMLKSYWLSNETAIKNPYYGNQMLTCGNIAEVIL